MQVKDLQLKRASRMALLVLLVCLAGMTKALAQSFTVNHLNFSVNGDGASVTITGHSIVSNTTGNLYIPSSVSYTFYENGQYVTQTYAVTRIGDYAFDGSTGFTGTLTIPPSITYIGVGAFANTDFTTVNFYATNCDDIAIGYYYAWYFYYYTYQGAFRYCPNLTTIHIGSNVQRIPAYLFNECDGLMGNLTLPSSLIEVGKEAFSGCSGLTGDLTIPNSVTTIGESAFSFCTGFTGSLSIGNSVTTIDASAFANCGFTGGLSIPNSVTTIGVSAFSNCTGFTGSLTIPNSVTSIGSSAFSGCTGFTGSLTIPNTITSIENSTFYGCSGLTGNLTIPNSVTSIGGSAFSGCTDFTGGLIIPNTITSIEEYTFYGCSGFMGNLSIPNSVTTIGKYAFDGCSGLTGELTIPSFVANIEVGAFANTGFTIVNFNATNCSDIEIGYSTVFAFNYYEYQGAFRYCPNLTTLHIGANVQRIPAYSFNDCEGLAGNLTLPSSLVEIGTEAFSGCSGFTGNLTIPNSVMTIGDDAFYGCSGFSGNLTIPNSVIMIGNWAFGNCSGFTGGLTISNSLAEIGIGVFYNCSGFTGGLTIPNSVTSIGSSAFYECSGFTGSLTIPNSVVELGDYAFNGCIGFTGSISILGGITSIGDGTFSGCNNLTGNLSIPTTVTEIGKYAFEGCSNLTGILTVPSSVTNIEVGAFANTGFTTVNFNATNCNDIEIGYSSMFSFNYYEYQGAFRYCPNLTTLHIGANVQRIPAYSFNDCEGLAGNLTLPSSLVEIGKSAFSWCTGFTGGITIPNSVTTIGEDAFSGCAGFTGSLTIGTSVVTIDSEAFYGCSGLTGNLTIPNSVVELGNYAFNGCTGFTGNLTIGSSVTSIGSWAFASCDNFDSIKVLVQIPPELENNAFNSLPTNIAVEVPCGTLNAYQNASGWSAFTNMQENCTTSFIITALANPSEGGTITGGGTYLQSTTCTLTATTNEDYVFVNWTENGIQISTNPTYVFSVTEDRTLVANFQLQSFVINASANPWAGGIVTGDGFYMQGSSCTLTATAHDEYVFFNWTENDSVVSTNATYTFTVTGERNLLANFLTGNIVFADANVKAICVANWDTNNDGELSYVEAAAVTTLGTVFKNNQTITSFNELQYFTGLTIIKGHDTERGSMVTPNGAFYNCNNLTSIIIPENVTTIGGNAFTFCKKLASINLPSAVTIINDYAFTYCYALATIEVYAETPPTLGNGVFNSVNKTIPVYVPCGTASAYQAANGWSQFTNIQERECLNYEITASVNPMEGGTVTGNGIYIQGTTCTLTATANDGYIFMNWTENGSVVSTDTIYSFIVTGARTLLANFEQETIDENITFADTVVKTLCVANWDTNGDGELSYAEAAAVTDIGMTFRNNNTITSFEELQYFTGLVSIVNGAFQYCGSLSSIIIPNSVISVGDHAFDRCYNLVSITMGNFVTSIGDHAFYYCSNLPSFTFGNSVISIGGYVFCYCYNLSSVSIGSSVNSIGTCAFAHCLELEQITVNVGNSVYDSRESCNAIIETASNTLIAGCKNTVIPNSVVSIGRNAFFYCSSLTSISIPSSVTSIGTDVFNGCGLEQITVDTENTVYDSRENCNAIIETASNTLMVGCSNTIIPNSVITIGIGAFYDRDNLTAIAIPNSVTSIGLSAFEQCNNLVSVIIGNSMSSIEDRAFYNCNGIDSMTMFVETPSALGNYVFYNVNKTIPVYVPVGTMTTYQAASGWNEFTNYQEIETIITQTINFNQGSNWFSSNVEITLDDLKATLLSALNNASGIKITSQSNGYTIWNGSSWKGSLNPFEVSQMYVIDVPSACEITLEAMPIDPAEQPITIFPGFNWIGFPLNTSMSVEDAFAGFAVSGDKISSKSQNAIYTGIRWEGTLNTLVPGQGYMFESSQTGNRTFIFPSGR